MQDFTIRNILFGCIHVVSLRWKLLLTALAPSLASIIAISWLVPENPSLPEFFFVLLIMFLLLSTMMLITHRIVIIPESVPLWGLSQFGKAEVFFLLHCLALMFFYLIGMFVAGLVGGPLLLTLATVLGAWLVSRVSLTFPAIATGEYVSFRDSWRMTKSHQATMLMAVVFFPIVLALVFGLAERMIPISSILFEPISMVFTIIALSLAYVQIRAPLLPDSDA